MNTAFVRSVCRILVVCVAALPLQAGAARATIEVRLQALGIAAQDAKDRVAALSDAEAASIAGRIDSLPAGAAGGGVGFVLVMIFLVWRFGFSDEAKAGYKEPAKPKPAPEQKK
jgi:hypothetical protein